MLIYREEIDGLRSIAVIPVILYHAGLRKYFSGGYVGVDIFFVISGYLITSVIENECKEGNFSLINFYERRCRRILPALFLILFLSSLFAYHLMLPEQLKEFGETLVSIICFNSNFYFWWRDDGYFSQISELNPLVHTWSLAVEEQFYLIFPLLCYLFYKRKRHLIILLICVAVISLFLSQWGENLESMSIEQFQNLAQHRYASFYLPTGRIWELLLGAFAAFYLRINDSPKKFSRKFNELFSLFGFILIIISVVFFDSRIIPPFPNLYTLVPTCGATLIILFGEKSTFVGYLLSTRLLRWIGLISYSAYLWHQPLLAFSRLQSDETVQFLTTILLVGAVFPLSLLSYFFVEQPFRNKTRFSRKAIFLIAGLSTLITLIIALFLIRTANNQSLMINEDDSYLSDLKKDGNQEYSRQKSDALTRKKQSFSNKASTLNRRKGLIGGSFVRSSKKKEHDSYLFDLKKYGNRDYSSQRFDALQREKKTFSDEASTLNRRIVLIGDSFARDFYNMIIEGKHLTNYEICGYTIYNECQIYLGEEDRNKYIRASHRQLCKRKHDLKYALPLIRQANIIILASSWHQWGAERLPNTIKLLNLTEQQQIFVIGTKNFGYFNPRLYVGKSKEFRIKKFQYPDFDIIKVNQLLEKTLPKSVFVDIQKMICTGPDQTCPHFTPKGKLITYDGKHLMKFGARYAGDIVFKNEPFNKLE